MSTDSSADARQTASVNQVLNYVAAATVSLILYDFLLGFSEDIRILSIRSLKLPDVIYVLSRLLTVGEVAVMCMDAALPGTSCHLGRLLLAAKCLVSVIVPCNSWLFLLRVRVIPSHFRSRTTVAICTILWASTFTSFLIFPGFTITDFPNEDGTCTLMTDYNSKLLCAPFIALVLFDTTTMVAISDGFIRQAPGRSWTEKLKSVMLVKHMGRMSGLFLRSGQIYYLATVGIHLSIFVISLCSTVHSKYIGQLSFLASIFHSIMTCRVFRLLKAGAFVYSESDSTTVFPLSTYSTETCPMAFQNTFDRSDTLTCS
ncbi:hypothetical protein QCA50_014868 [Cerrena zonata]|uniref:G-protein coupled receptors family 1 profile domain-containing protein n=1 Tax=Cerrena zonata TaxID=2478898 RepID=A0AAW0FMI2_9APHY